MRGRTDGNRGEKGAREDAGGGQGKDKGGTDAVQENTTGRIAERSGGKDERWSE